MGITKLDYCQFLLSSQVNYTATYMADHLENFSHDTINRYLSGANLRPRHLWEQVEPLLEQDSDAYLLFDDTVLDKRYGPEIELSRPQWSGKEKRTLNGIGLVSCVYVHPTSGRFHVIDYRIYAPERDGKTKLQHVKEMFQNVLERGVLCGTVLMDSWYATKDLMMQFQRAGKRFYCPVKCDRQVDDSGGLRPYRRVDSLDWSGTDSDKGKTVKVKNFPGDYKVQVFRVVVSSHRTEYVVTNDTSQTSAEGARKECAVRWKIEEMHRGLKQLTGIERCQSRKASSQRNHIHCALFVWTRLQQLAEASGRTAYQIKEALLSDYLIQQLKIPTYSLRRA